MICVAMFMSASGRTITWFFAPPWHCARHVFEVVALHHHRDAAGDFDVLDRAPQLGFSFSESLPVFLRDDPAQFVKVILKKLFQLEERLNAVFRWRAAPFRPCRCGCFNGTGYFSGA